MDITGNTNIGLQVLNSIKDSAVSCKSVQSISMHLFLKQIMFSLELAA
jgi:hypothetical protein